MAGKGTIASITRDSGKDRNFALSIILACLYVWACIRTCTFSMWILKKVYVLRLLVVFHQQDLLHSFEKCALDFQVVCDIPLIQQIYL